MVHYWIWCFCFFINFLRFSVPQRCHKQMLHVLFFTHIKLVVHVLACAHETARIKWRRLVYDKSINVILLKIIFWKTIDNDDSVIRFFLIISFTFFAYSIYYYLSLKTLGKAIYLYFQIKLKDRRKCVLRFKHYFKKDRCR